jgi:hypothetical protein
VENESVKVVYIRGHRVLSFKSSARPKTRYGRATAQPKETVLVADIVPGSNSSYPDELFDLNGTLYFSALTDLGDELWTAQAPVRVALAPVNPPI